MLASILSNFGILLFMHMQIDHLYSLNLRGKISDSMTHLIHILIGSFFGILLMYFPIYEGNYNFDLRIIPIIMVGFIRGWTYLLPIALISEVARFFMGGNMVSIEILMSIIFPTFIGLYLYPLEPKQVSKKKLILIFSLAWLGADLFLFILSEDFASLEIHLLFARYIVVVLAGIVICEFSRSVREKWSLLSQLALSAELDALTGLYNMRKFEEVISKVQLKEKLGFIAMVDIDYFKKINDFHGHQVGDEAIRAVADIFRMHVSKDVFCARYGGDEFIFFLRVDSFIEALDILERIRMEVEKTCFLSRTLHSPNISISIGVSQILDLRKLRQCIEQADKQLYISKSEGRNRICG